MTVHSEQSHQTQSTSTDELSLNGNYSYSNFTPDSGEIIPDILPNITVDSAHSLWQRMIETKNRLKLSGKKLAAIATISTTALLATACSQEANPTETPSATSTSTPDTTPSPEVTQSPEAELSVEKLRVPTGLDAETLGKTIVEDRFDAWDNAGANDSLLARIKKAGLAWGEFLPIVAKENAQIFADALYIDGWQSNDNLSNYVKGEEETNLATLDAYKSTAWNKDEHPENIEPYRQWSTVESVIELGSSGGDERTLEITYTSHDNSDKNMIESNTRTGNNTFTITFKAVDGFEKIVSINIR